MKKIILTNLIFILFSLPAFSAQINAVSQLLQYKGSHIDDIKFNASGSFFIARGVKDNEFGKQVILFNRSGKAVLRWHDPDPQSFYSAESGTWEYDDATRDYAIFPRSNKFAVLNSGLKIVDFNGNIIARVDKGKRKYHYMERVFISPAEDRIVVSANDGNYQKYYFFDGNLNYLHTVNFPTIGIFHYDLAFSPDGKNIAISKDWEDSANGWRSSLQLYDKDGKFVRDVELHKPGKVITTPDGPLERPAILAKHLAFSPDGKWLAYIMQASSSYDSWIVVYSMEKKSSQTFYAKRAAEAPLMFTPDSKSLIVQSVDKGLLFYKLNGELLIAIGVNVSGPDYSIAKVFSNPDGEHIVVSESPYKSYLPSAYRLGVVDHRGKESNRITLNTQPSVYSDVRMNHDGSEIAFILEDTIYRDSNNVPSIIWNTKTNKLEKVKGSIRYDKWGKRIVQTRHKNGISQFDVNEKTTLIKGDGFMLPNRQVCILEYDYGYDSNHFILYDQEGEALGRYPGSNVCWHTNDFHPNMKYYLQSGSELTTLKKGTKERHLFDQYIVSFGRFSPDGEHALVGTGLRDVSVYNLDGSRWEAISQSCTSEHCKYHFKGHFLKALSAATTMNNQVILSVGADNQIILRNRKTKTIAYLEIVNISSWKDDSWDLQFVVTTSNGYYEVSDGLSDNMVILSQNGKVVSKKIKGKYKTDNLLWKVIQGKI